MSFTLLGREIPFYGVFFWLGIIVAAVAAIFVCKRKGLSLFDLTCSAVYALIAAIIGAKLLYIMVSWKSIIEFADEYGLSFAELLPLIIKGGFVFYGGLVGGILGLIIYAKQFKTELSLLLNIYSAVVPLGHAFGRVGCFFGGCCYGTPYNGPFSHIYEVPTGAAPVGVPLFPIQLVEAFLLLLLFAVQLVLLLKVSARNALVYNYAFSYSVIRFVLEFFRGDAERGALLFLSTSQWISIAICIASLLMMYKQYHKNGKQERGLDEYGC